MFRALFPVRGALGALSAAALGVACFPVDVRDLHGAVVERYQPTPEAVGPSMDPENALGPPDGRTVALGEGAFIEVRFFRMIPDGPGPDLRIYEVGDDGATARVAASVDSVRFREFPAPARGPVSTYDLLEIGLDGVGHVRIEGLDSAGIEPGFDLDAVEALH